MNVEVEYSLDNPRIPSKELEIPVCFFPKKKLKSEAEMLPVSSEATVSEPI